MRKITGGCHCRNIRYEFVWPLDELEIPVRACSCSFCTKHRGTYTSHPEAELEATIADATLVTYYRFGTETADFYVCSQCGVVPFVVSHIDARDHAVVNVHTFEDVDPSVLIPRTTNFDGETLDGRLDRRKKTWMSTVSIQFMES